MENLLPRKITTAEELKKFNPYLLEDDEGYDEADYEGINDVSILEIENFLNFLFVLGSP